MINFPLCFKLFYKEIIRRWAFNFFFVVNLSFGLVGLLLVNSFQDSVAIYLEKNLRDSLGADIAIYSNQPFSQEQERVINKNSTQFAEVNKKIEFFSMLRSAKRSKLVRIVAVDDKFPLYGDFKLINGVSIRQELKQNSALKKVWMLEDSRYALGLEKNETIQLGDSSFAVSEDISSATNGIISFNFAPKLYVHLDSIAKTNLLTKGSRIQYAILYRLRNPKNAENIAKEIRDNLFDEFDKDSGLRVRTYINANNQISTLLQRASGYLSMLSLIALFLAGVGAAYLARSNIAGRLTDMAIFQSLGLIKREVYWIFILQALFFGLMATVLAIFLAGFMLPLANDFLKEINLNNLNLTLTFKSIFIVILTGLIGSVAFCFATISQIRFVNPQQLLNNNENSTVVKKNYFSLLIPYLPAVFFIWAISVYQSNVIEGSLFLLLFFLGLLFFGFLGWLLILLCRKISDLSNPVFRIALRNISRHQWGTITSFIALGLGSFLMSVIPQIHNGLSSEIDGSDKMNVPSVFVFDIQDEQIEPLRLLVKKAGFNLQEITPMISARLKSVDGEAPTQRWFNQDDANGNNENIRLDRSVRLTYRNHLLEAEEILSGEALAHSFTGSGEKNDPIGVSIEQRYANRMDAKIGTLLEFDVQGISIFGQVKNVRKVKWNSFQPNFFLILEPGLLEFAPKTFLASISNLNRENRLMMQDKIVDQFSNISVLDIADVVLQVLKLSNQLSLAFTIIALFAVLIGLMVIYSISKTEAKLKTSEMNLFKVLGGLKKQTYQIFLIEYSIISSISALFGILLSLIASIFISQYLFDTYWTVNIYSTILIWLGINIIAISITIVSASQVLKKKAWNLLHTA